MHNKFFYHYKVEANIVRCPDPIIAEKMIQRIDEIRFVISVMYIYSICMTVLCMYVCMYVCMCVPGGVGIV